MINENRVKKCEALKMKSLDRREKWNNRLSDIIKIIGETFNSNNEFANDIQTIKEVFCKTLEGSNDLNIEDANFDINAGLYLNKWALELPEIKNYQSVLQQMIPYYKTLNRQNDIRAFMEIQRQKMEPGDIVLLINNNMNYGQGSDNYRMWLYAQNILNGLIYSENQIQRFINYYNLFEFLENEFFCSDIEKVDE